MNLYFNLLHLPVFNMDDVNQYYNNIESARSAVKRLVKKGLVLKIRNNLYTCVSGETNGPVANRFQIASAINENSYISHHTAMEYYGIYNQIYNDVYVSSSTKFNSFEFDGYNYIYVPSKMHSGIVSLAFSGCIKTTDLERTVLDCLKDIDKISGLEEIIGIVEDLPELDENKLLDYLEDYNNQFLYQKTGFFLENIYRDKKISDQFFNICLSRIGQSRRYLTKDFFDDSIFVSRWQIVVPLSIIRRSDDSEKI